MVFQLSLSVFLLTFCHWTNALMRFQSHCPEVKIVEDFKLDDYMGIWYEYAKYTSGFEIGKRCRYNVYENTGDGFISVVNVAEDYITGGMLNATGKAKVIASGRLAVTFPGSKNPYLVLANNNDSNYLILDTDYTSFAVVYSCLNLSSSTQIELVWILTRNRKPSYATIFAANQVMDDNNLPQRNLREIDQDNCPDPRTMVKAKVCIKKLKVNPERNLATTNSIDKALIMLTTISFVMLGMRHICLNFNMKVF